MTETSPTWRHLGLGNKTAIDLCHRTATPIGRKLQRTTLTTVSRVQCMLSACYRTQVAGSEEFESAMQANLGRPIGRSGAATAATFETSATRGRRHAPVAHLPYCANLAVLSWLFAADQAIFGALTAAERRPLPSFPQRAGYWQTAPVQRVPFPVPGDPARRWAHGNSCKPSPYECPPRRRSQNTEYCRPLLLVDCNV